MASWLWDSGTGPLPRPRLSEEFALDLLAAAQTAWPGASRSGIPWRMKPPNDLYIGGKKIAGLLLEILDQGEDKALILGLGFNALRHPPAVSEAGHLEEYTKRVSRKKWEAFLDHLHSLWTKRINGQEK